MNSQPFTKANEPPKLRPDTGQAASYIRSAFRPEDRLAVVVLNRSTGAATQRITSAEKISSPEFQEWLRQRNVAGCEIYVSMNALKESASGRTKEDVDTIRHVFLDFDYNGDAAIARLRQTPRLPEPTYHLSTSPGKHQVVWKVEGFTGDEAEALQRNLARATGADIAATDRARVLRLPGYYNHKYDEPYLVQIAAQSPSFSRLEDFPRLEARKADARERRAITRPRGPRELSQSERDWAFARRALARGEREDTVIATIASYRRFDKPNPDYYARLTVGKAAESLERSNTSRPDSSGRNR